MRINTNIPALQSYNALTNVNNQLQKSINRLSTGLRINSAADDAAGLAISEKMRAQYRGLDQAANNAQDGISMIQTAEGALSETHSILQRMRELSVQAANDTLTQEDRAYIQLEIDQLKEEVTRISTTTQFNKKQLLDGSAAALWSSDNLETKAIINGGLRAIDQFGQKAAVEGNFKIRITAEPGKAQIQKSDIFKIKHENVIMNVNKDTSNGFESVRVDGLPAGDYSVTNNELTSATSAGLITATYSKEVNAGNADPFASLTVGFSATGNLENLSMLFEVVSKNEAANTVTFRVQVSGLDADGKTVNYTEENFMVTSAGIGGDGATIGWNVALADRPSVMALTSAGDGAAALDFNVGDKMVVNNWIGSGTAKADTGLADTQIVTSAVINQEWNKSWSAAAGALPIESKFSVNAANVQDKEIHFKSFYLNTANGTHYEGDIVIGFNDNFEAVAGGGAQQVGATFEAAYVGQVAKGDVALRDLDKFWDANGKFMLDDPKTLTIVQGDGKKTNVTLYSTDTLDDVAKKLNNAIAYGLDQAKYLSQGAENFVNFVEQGEETADSPQSVRGTFVINSLVAGKNGTINFSGDEDIIKAFSLNVIQKEQENTFRVSINDAHSGNSLASNVKITGNTLYGTINANVDVVFDTMANVEASWNDLTKSFDLKKGATAYETTLHLADNTTVFQIGANEGEDMGINIGNMSSEALGIANIIVTDRESAARSITILDGAIQKVSMQRAKLGAYQNRLEHTINNLTTASTNMKSSESRIRDADMAKEMMEFTKLNILSQAGNSMLAQANQLPQNILSLLR